MMGDPEETTKKHGIDDDARDDQDGSEGNHHNSVRKRQRIRLSCLECRRRKLSCSRELPCDRCIKSGTPERCSYESRPEGPSTGTPARNPYAPVDASFASYGADARRPVTGQHPTPTRRDVDASAALKDVARDQERIRKLELEVIQLKNALAKPSPVDSSTIVASPATSRDATKDTPPSFATHHPLAAFVEEKHAHPKVSDSITCFRSRYFGPHNAWSSLRDITGISYFMKETADEWLRPLNIQKKDRGKRTKDRERKFAESDPALEEHLPSKEETDSLLNVYLDQFEQLYRIVHISAFRKEYEKFWDPDHVRPASFTALVLSMLSVSCCLGMQASGKFIGVKSSAYALAEKWVKVCDAWLESQSHKHRKMVHYQIDCLLFLAKRVNVIKKKRFWALSGQLVHDAISIGLHRDPDTQSPELSVYTKEMRRRIWATIVELNLQASFDLGVPTLLSQVHNDVDPPSNIDDDSFDQESTELPMSRPRTDYTFSSYAHLSRQSLPVRLEVCKILTGPPVNLDWEQVLRYTDMITQEIDALPSWDLDSDQTSEISHKPSLAHTLLHIQLRQFLIPLHQPFLKQRQNHSRYQASEFIYYTAARDLILMHDRLFQKGIRTLYFLREDSINSAMNLCNVALLQPKSSMSLINSNNQETLKLIEKCIALKEDRVLRCGNNDPWGYSSMCAAYGLVETHLGLKTREAARAKAAERFISLHYKLASYQVPTTGQEQGSQTQPKNQTQLEGFANINAPMTVGTFPTGTNGNIPPTPGSTSTSSSLLPPPPPPREGMPFSVPWLMTPTDTTSQLVMPTSDFSFELLGSDLNDLWGDWSGADFM
ncbi:hypothetical protein GGS20DRAFT_499518 [Poronia punctata]|nr:hypothetical protein GGS20DRAFT_499518 [Poronia punctata]